MTFFGLLTASSGPLWYKKSNCRCSESTHSLHKLVLLENIYISNFDDIKIYEKWQKVIISLNFNQFLDPWYTLCPLLYKKVHVVIIKLKGRICEYVVAPFFLVTIDVRAQNVSIASINLYHQKCIHIQLSWYENVQKMPKSHNID